jgi:hypothetical protein
MVVPEAVEVVMASAGTAMEAGAAMIAAWPGTVWTAGIDMTIAAIGTAMEIGGSTRRGMVEATSVGTTVVGGVGLWRMVFKAAAIGAAAEARIRGGLIVWRTTAMFKMATAGRTAMLGLGCRSATMRGATAMRGAATMLFAATAAMTVVVMARLSESGKGKKGNNGGRNKQFSHIACPENGWKVTGPPGLSSLCCGAILLCAHERFFHPCRD